MGHYKSKLGFFRIGVLKILTKMAVISVKSGFFDLFYLIERLHFRVYTGMSLKKALNDRKKIAIGATRRTREILKAEINKKNIHPIVRNEVLSVIYMLYVKKQANATFLDLLIGKKQ